MPQREYSIALCRELAAIVRGANLEVPRRVDRYEPGEVLDLAFTTVWPEVRGRGLFRIDRFVGGGFAGQVYRCILDELQVPRDAKTGLKTGRAYAVKILVPPTKFARRFRDAIYWLGFQAPFSLQVNRAACKAALLHQKLTRHACGKVFGREDAVREVYASFYDDGLGAFGEIMEWLEGRTWRLECDTGLRARRNWKKADPRKTGSPEYVAKRQFMARMVTLLHDMGAAELARQYEWWTMKSQPNVLKRSGHDSDPAAGLCAVDFRAGLALLPFLPMSFRDFGLICSGLKRGALVQFDRCDFRKLRAFCVQHANVPGELTALVDTCEGYDLGHRRSYPDITHQGWRILVERELRNDIRKGLSEAYLSRGLVDHFFARSIEEGPWKFAAFYLLGAIPILGRTFRRLWGNTDYRHHVTRIVTDRKYRERWLRSGVASRLSAWHRSGRTGEPRTRFLLDHPGLFWFRRVTLGILPARLHRALADPGYVVRRVREGWRFVVRLYRDADFRERWFSGIVEEGYRDGMLDEAERNTILAHVRDPFIVKYLKSLAVHFATLPVTQIVSVITGAVAAAWVLARGGSGKAASGAFFGIVVFFQFIPVSPGSICRGAYVVYLMIRERNFRDYMVAAPVAFVKYLGYLAFPFQMVTSYPELSRFMASRWATSATGIVPVFGEKGALLEHMVFDMCFNVPRSFGRWARPRMKGILDVWLLIGLAVLLAAFWGFGVLWSSTLGINLLIAVTALFVLPRVLFYPVLMRKRRRRM